MMRKKIVYSFFVVLCAISTFNCFAFSSVRANTRDPHKEVISQLYDYIQQNYVEEVDPEVLYQGAIKGMLSALDDPYSTYMDSAEWRSLTDVTQGEFGGVGLSITKPAESTPEKPAYVEVASPIDDSPGFKAGIQSGDLIVKIEDVDTSTISMEEVLSMLRGTVGETVHVTIRRGKNYEFECALVRAVIENPTVRYDMIGSTGYIKVTEFSSKTLMRIQEALDSFKSKNYDSLIIDLRYNGGGLLTAAVGIADKFIDEGTIVETKSRIEFENFVYKASSATTVVSNIPVIVLINGASASASEILSGALKDTKKAVLVGEKTFGKGSVQVPSGLFNNDGFKITVARYYSPSDANIDKRGIKPDLEISLPLYDPEWEASYVSLVESNDISSYVESHPDMTEKQISDYADVLSKKYSVDKVYIRKLIRNECDKGKPSRLYDLDFDTQLSEALKVFKDGRYKTLLEASKTLKETELLEDDASLNKAAE
ncbi:MAG: S41 family peptidase [Treponema sp.]|nr:S41 family peptidase [Treponema sp.]